MLKLKLPILFGAILLNNPFLGFVPLEETELRAFFSSGRFSIATAKDLSKRSISENSRLLDQCQINPIGLTIDQASELLEVAGNTTLMQILKPLREEKTDLREARRQWNDKIEISGCPELVAELDFLIKHLSLTTIILVQKLHENFFKERGDEVLKISQEYADEKKLSRDQGEYALMHLGILRLRDYAKLSTAIKSKTLDSIEISPNTIELVCQEINKFFSAIKLLKEHPDASCREHMLLSDDNQPYRQLGEALRLIENLTLIMSATSLRSIATVMERPTDATTGASAVQVQRKTSPARARRGDHGFDMVFSSVSTGASPQEQVREKKRAHDQIPAEAEDADTEERLAKKATTQEARAFASTAIDETTGLESIPLAPPTVAPATLGICPLRKVSGVEEDGNLNASPANAPYECFSCGA